MVQTAAPARTIEEIMSWYQGQNPGVLTNLYRLLNHGRLGGTGKLVILPVDQGFEHGPTRSFAPNPDAYDPLYHFRLAIEAGCSAYAAPLGFLEAGAAQYAGQIPLILKLNNHDILQDEIDPLGAQTGTVDDALRLGCIGIGYTIYPGTLDRRLQYEQFAEIAAEAKAAGLLVVLWSYARGGGMQSADETGLDTITYAAHLAAQLGAHIIKVKLPTSHFMDAKSKKLMDEAGIPYETLAQRVNYLIKAVFDGRRIVINSGGSAASDEAVFDQVRAIRDGGGFGSIIGRNSFQRPWDTAIDFLRTIMDILAGDIE
ncbi:MAG TPA: class I fructose-bisphosphate aldolase [Aggregatilineales bacterium]|nr:class I fructose-bisphosphate aldolase [Aggregatilineales bacterium]